MSCEALRENPEQRRSQLMLSVDISHAWCVWHEAHRAAHLAVLTLTARAGRAASPSYQGCVLQFSTPLNYYVPSRSRRVSERESAGS